MRGANSFRGEREPLMLKKIEVEDLEALVSHEDYVAQDLLTICTLTLTNGFKLVGTSAAMSEEWYDYELGKEIARKRAFEQLWQLEGYHRMRVAAEA